MIPVAKPMYVGSVYNYNKNTRDPGHEAVEVDDFFYYLASVLCEKKVCRIRSTLSYGA